MYLLLYLSAQARLMWFAGTEKIVTDYCADERKACETFFEQSQWYVKQTENVVERLVTHIKPKIFEDYVDLGNKICSA